MRYLSLAEILDVIANVFEEKEVAGIRSWDLLESAIGKPKSSFGGVELYEGVLLKSLVLCEALIKNHPLLDGNKRTGVIAMLIFLEMNGHNTTRIPDDILYEVAVGFADGSLGREEAVELLKPFLIKDVET